MQINAYFESFRSSIETLTDDLNRIKSNEIDVSDSSAPIAIMEELEMVKENLNTIITSCNYSSFNGSGSGGTQSRVNLEDLFWNLRDISFCLNQNLAYARSGIGLDHEAEIAVEQMLSEVPASLSKDETQTENENEQQNVENKEHENIQKEEQKTPIKNPVENNKKDEVVVDLRTPTLESLGLSKTAMDLFQKGSNNNNNNIKTTPKSRQSLFSNHSNNTPPVLRTITKNPGDPIRDSFSSISSPQIKTKLSLNSVVSNGSNKRNSESLCKTIKLIEREEYDKLEDFVKKQFDYQTMNEGIQVLNEYLLDKQLSINHSNKDINFHTITLDVFEQLGFGSSSKALLLSLLQTDRLAMNGLDATTNNNKTKTYRVN